MYNFNMRGLSAVCAAALLAVSIFLLPAFAPAEAFAEGTVSARPEMSVVNTQQGAADVGFAVKLDNQSGNIIKGIKAEIVHATGFSNEKCLSSQDATLGAGESSVYRFSVDVDANTNYGTHTIPIRFTYDGGECSTSVSINVARNILPPSAGFDTPVADVAYKLDGDSMKASETTNLGVTLTNRGNVMLQDVQISLDLPDIMSLDNSAFVQFVGYMGVGESKTVKFPILTDKKAENKNYVVTIKISAVNKGATVSFDRPIHIPVTGGEQSGAVADVLIGNINLPREAAAGEEFTLTFDVTNNGKGVVNDLKIEVSPEAGLVNKTKNLFVETKLNQGETKSYAVTLFSSKEKTEQKSYPIKISASGPKDGTGVTQYASIFLNKPPADDMKTPRLMVESYNYGGGFVQAGNEFDLSIGLLNTSPKRLSNIKVTFTSENGAIIPVGGSNSFYINSMGPNASAFKKLRMAAAPTAEQRTTALNLSMVYEDDDGDEFTSADLISIPIMQETALSVSDIAAPPDLRAGVQATMSVQFYNVGKTLLRNVQVVATGDFATKEPLNYYAGNLDSGSSDSYDFAFVPNDVEQLTGKVTFVYYDPSGNENRIEREFSFPVQPPAPAEVPEMIEEPDPLAVRIKLYAIAGAALLAVIAIAVLLRTLKNRKLHKELNIDE